MSEEQLRFDLELLMRQTEYDLASAHAEICKLQGIDPETNSWPAWSPQANTLHWIKQLRERYNSACTGCGST